MKLSSILIALDSSPEAQAGLQAAAELAGKAGATIKTLHIEDVNWYRATQTSIVQHISRQTGEQVKADEEELSRQSKALQHRLENRVVQISRQWQVNYVCNAVRGEINEELMQAAEEADLVLAGRRGTSFHSRNEVGSSALHLARSCSKPVLLWSDYQVWPLTIYGLGSDPAASSAMAGWVVWLSEQLERQARFVWLGKHENAEAARQKLSESELSAARAADILAKTPMQTMEHPGDIFQLSGWGLLVLDRKDPLLQEVDLENLLSNMHNPTLLL